MPTAVPPCAFGGVPGRSRVELRAAYTPDAARSVSGHPQSLSRRNAEMIDRTATSVLLRCRAREPAGMAHRDPRRGREGHKLISSLPAFSVSART